MRILKKYWWVGVLLLIGGGLYLYAGRNEKPSKEFKAEQKALSNTDAVILNQQEIILKSMELQERMIGIYESNAAALLNIIDKNNQAIEQNKRQTNEQINRVRAFNSSDITSFYAELERQHDLHP